MAPQDEGSPTISSHDIAEGTCPAPAVNPAGLTCQAGQWYANLANQLGDFDPAAGLATFREGIQFAERRGLTELAMWMRGGTLERPFELGRWDELLREAEEIVAWYRGHGPESFIILSAEIQRARVLLFRGQLLAADELIERSRRSADVPYMDRLVTLTIAALVKQARKEPAAADAVVAEARGDPEGAAALYEQAANGWEASGNALERGQALLGLGRCLGRLGRPEAGSRLREARAVLGDLGCHQLVAETDGWLQQDTAQTGWGAVGGRAP